MKRNVTGTEAPLARSVDEAISSRNSRPLWAWLCKHSNLPGPTPNVTIAQAFADTCSMHGSKAEKIVIEMATLDADSAPGDTELEFLPMCGVLAAGAIGAAHDRLRGEMLDVLHDRADDLRFRVRDAVVEALATIGGVTEDALVLEVEPWMDGYFHAAAVLRALAKEAWLPHLHEVTPVVMRLDEAFNLAKNAPRAAARYPGRKALIETLSQSPAAVANRFGVPIFDLLEKWTSSKDPELREVIVRNLKSKALSARYRPEVERVDRAIVATTPAARDLKGYDAPMRGRGRKRR